MEYTAPLRYHYKPRKGWMNDPNGLVYFKGYYHVFYQHAPHHEIPWQEPMHWGHARTKDFLTWEELPVALTPGAPYDGGGCWSGTAIVKGDKLFLFYAAKRCIRYCFAEKYTTQSADATYRLHLRIFCLVPLGAEKAPVLPGKEAE